MKTAINIAKFSTQIPHMYVGRGAKIMFLRGTPMHLVLITLWHP